MAAVKLGKFLCAVKARIPRTLMSWTKPEISRVLKVETASQKFVFTCGWDESKPKYDILPVQAAHW
jgi:hypothetical protein